MKAKQSVRTLAMQHLENGATIASTAASVRVSRRTVQRWKKQAENCDKILRPERRSLNQQQEEAVIKFVEQRPGIYMKHIVQFVSETFGIGISRDTASRIMRRNNITRKKGTRVNNRFRPDLGKQFLDEISSTYTPLIASIDEMSIMLNSAPSHGYATRGKRAVIPQPSRRTVSYMLILSVCPVGVLHWTLRSGTINAEIFCNTLAKLPNGLTLILDNARIHHASKCLPEKGLPTVAELAESKSMDLKYTPPYAPHLNPVEFVFNTVRSRKGAWTESSLAKSLASLFRSNPFGKKSMTKLFLSVINGGPNPGERQNL